MKNMVKKREDKGQKVKIVKIDVNDILELAKKIVAEQNGGIGVSDIEYVGGIKYLKFAILDMTEKGKCNNLCPPEIEEGGEGGCGETGGSCICGESEGHKGDCICKLCGHEF